MSKITVVGSFVTDMVATMSRFPRVGESVIGERLRVYPGGKGANQCVAARRLGAQVSMVGMLGDDENGRNFRTLFEKEGIDTKYVFTTRDEPTAVAQVQIDQNSDNRICVIPGANYCFTPEYLEKAKSAIADADMVIAQLELTMDVTDALAKLCAELGVPLMLNPAPAAPLSEEVLKNVTYLTPNESELSVLTGLPADTNEQIIAACEALLRKGVKTVVATLGSRGAYAATAEGGLFVESFKVKPVDTVAAGDSFNAALAVAVTEGRSLYESLRFANAMGALTVQVKGAIPSLHSREEVEEFLHSRA